jgi:hypothetical protein
MKIMKKEVIIKNDQMQRLKREIGIMRSIKDAHPFILNLVSVVQTKVSIRPKLLHLFNNVCETCMSTRFIASTTANNFQALTEQFSWNWVWKCVPFHLGALQVLL